MIKLDDTILSQVILARKSNTHKSDYGKVLCIGGNKPYTGAIMIAASACLHSGTGLTYVATDKDGIGSINAFTPEIIAFDITNKELLDDLLNKVDVVLIGCGLTTSQSSKDLLEYIINNFNKTIIIDGDAITLFALYQMKVQDPSKLIFTPHQKELERLTGIVISSQSNENIQAYTSQTNYTIIAKSNQTKIFSKDKPIYYLDIGKPSQATGGMGDSLAGMIASFVGQFKTYESILAATYLHSKIAHDLDKDNYMVLPTSIIKEIPKYMKKAIK